MQNIPIERMQESYYKFEYIYILRIELVSYAVWVACLQSSASIHTDMSLGPHLPEIIAQPILFFVVNYRTLLGRLPSNLPFLLLTTVLHVVDHISTVPFHLHVDYRTPIGRSISPFSYASIR
ncbi:hypothetical protein PENTCL1PPCAC_24041 [Pristionchus entomophagus]|uniref:G protein-coupled receptor n=1 Tax=Pristionchus entomophagus TaxID=358040 RepID=A0AAV5U515_9BILA|nr:hypothetical protein PENTCL1PPCAC_24041 [Pristionchus entomophagus]